MRVISILGCILGKDGFTFRIMKSFLKTLSLVCVVSLFGCTTIKTEHHITLDHNITIKIEKEVNDFLDDLYDDEPANE
ncbi:MAG: hypothetical protein CMI21_08650 [Opitutae bacterium]|nr:hypothetical protein [Opitutae bacterium]